MLSKRSEFSSSMLGHEKGKRIPVIRRAGKNKFMNQFQEESCDTTIRQFVGFPKGQKRRRLNTKSLGTV